MGIGEPGALCRDTGRSQLSNSRMCAAALLESATCYTVNQQEMDIGLFVAIPETIHEYSVGDGVGNGRASTCTYTDSIEQCGDDPECRYTHDEALWNTFCFGGGPPPRRCYNGDSR